MSHKSCSAIFCDIFHQHFNITNKKVLRSEEFEIISATPQSRWNKQENTKSYKVRGYTIYKSNKTINAYRRLQMKVLAQPKGLLIKKPWIGLPQDNQGSAILILSLIIVHLKVQFLLLYLYLIAFISLKTDCMILSYRQLRRVDSSSCVQMRVYHNCYDLEAC
uniref:Uncharacterized protein n=1 Tax=Glossina austeni TaxID=7395 RepID=A0A1A9UXN4_GLOAU